MGRLELLFFSFFFLLSPLVSSSWLIWPRSSGHSHVDKNDSALQLVAILAVFISPQETKPRNMPMRDLAVLTAQQNISLDISV